MLRDVQTCREWGFPIEVEDDRARLARDADLLVPAWIEEDARSTAWSAVRAHGYLEIGSTNDEALARANAGAPQGTLIFAERQTAGKGRMGRTWMSPSGAGLYFTLVLRPRQTLEAWPSLTHVASVALFRSIRDVSLFRLTAADLRLDLKWPNDVLLSGKKVAGILLETALRGENGQAAVVGVGVNVLPRSVPAELSTFAATVGTEAGAAVPRRWLLIRFLTHFRAGYHLFETGSLAEIIEQWKNCSTMWDGVEITVQEGTRSKWAVTCGLTKTGALRIRNEKGCVETLLVGDVSIRRH